MEASEILRHRVSKKTLDQLIDYVCVSRDRFEDLFKLFYTSTGLVRHQSAWALSYCVEQYPDWITPHIGKLIRLVETVDEPSGIRRSVMRMLQFASIPKRLHGRAVNACFARITDPDEAVAVKVFAMTVCANIAEQNEEIARELRLILEDQLPYGTAGFRSRATKVLRRLDKAQYRAQEVKSKKQEVRGNRR
jgi:hypothetical protein